MFGHGDLENLIELAGVYRMVNGWQVIVRADWVDCTDQQPHCIDYALILQDTTMPMPSTAQRLRIAGTMSTRSDE
jgi:hypothetical protein